jgi:hypothetical protein
MPAHFEDVTKSAVRGKCPTFALQMSRKYSHVAGKVLKNNDIAREKSH